MSDLVWTWLNLFELVSTGIGVANTSWLRGEEEASRNGSVPAPVLPGHFGSHISYFNDRIDSSSRRVFLEN